jgi:hypothetical protein
MLFITSPTAVANKGLEIDNMQDMKRESKEQDKWRLEEQKK